MFDGVLGGVALMDVHGTQQTNIYNVTRMAKKGKKETSICQTK